MQGVLTIEPLDLALHTRAVAIIRADQSITPERRQYIINMLSSNELSPTASARQLIKMYEQNEEDYILGGIGNAYYDMLRKGIRFLQTGGAGRPKTRMSPKFHYSALKLTMSASQLKPHLGEAVSLHMVRNLHADLQSRASASSLGIAISTSRDVTFFLYLSNLGTIGKHIFGTSFAASGRKKPS